MAAHRQAVLFILVALVVAGITIACSTSPSGPGDTTISLTVDQVTSPTNQLMPNVTGTTDPGASVTVETPVDTATGTATNSGGFSVRVTLAADQSNQVRVSARDAAGNQASETQQVLHDGTPPAISINQPLAGATTAGQTGFDITVAFNDGGSGIDGSSLSITSGLEVGGVYRSDGTTSIVYTAGTSLLPMFAVTGSEATTTVDDTLIFRAGSNVISAQVSDLAGNSSTLATQNFTVTADTPSLVLTDASGSAGATGIPVAIALANADSVSGVQFDMLFDPAVIASVDSVTVTGRAASMDGTPFNQIQAGQVRVLLFDSGGDAVTEGQGAIVNVWVTVAGGAATGGHTLTANAVVLSDPQGGTLTGLGPFLGSFTVQ
jgi:hypothetical protein